MNFRLNTIRSIETHRNLARLMDKPILARRLSRNLNPKTITVSPVGFDQRAVLDFFQLRRLRHKCHQHENHRYTQTKSRHRITQRLLAHKDIINLTQANLQG